MGILSGRRGGRGSGDELRGEDEVSGRAVVEQESDGLGALREVRLADGGQRR